MTRNYQRELDLLISSLDKPPRLLLHACCAPCASYVLEYLSDYFDITLFFYNPNIDSFEEYEKRLAELARLVNTLPHKNNIEIINGEYTPHVFFNASLGLENEPERGKRCDKCFYLRLEETVKAAKADDFDYFCTTLSISPHKNAALLNKIGEELAEKYGIPYLPSDFKKKGGYLRSIELSKKYNLYRQNFCGCRFSKDSAGEINE